MKNFFIELNYGGIRIQAENKSEARKKAVEILGKIMYDYNITDIEQDKS